MAWRPLCRGNCAINAICVTGLAAAKKARRIGAKQMLVESRAMRRWLVKLAQEALPDDPDIQIQALK
jgi:sulfatase maturation enzyme AslB (radical SAM superfamily)